MNLILKKNARSGSICRVSSAILISGFILMLILFLTGCAREEATKIRVGLGEAIITPPVGTPMSGYDRRGQVSTGVHDDLHARSLVIEDGHTALVLMSVSVINVGRKNLEEIRSGINKQTGIPEPNIIISATHTHSGPAIGEQAPYREFFVERCIQSAVEAWNQRIPGRVGIGSTEVLELGRNDRRLGYGGLHPDPEAAIIKVEDAKGRLRGVAFNYGCHPSTLDLRNLEFTEDWPYYAIQGIKEKVGKQVWVAYFQSAEGDVKVGYTAELSAVGAEMPIRNFWYAEIKGRQMSEAVLKVLPRIITSGDPILKVTQGFFDYPLRDSYPMTVKEAEKRYEEAKTKVVQMEKQAEAIGNRVLDAYRVEEFLARLALSTAQWVESHPQPRPLSLEQQAVRIGDAVFVTFPVEVFSEIGLKVKERSPFEQTFVIGLASGYGGYIPTAAEYLEGGYAVVMTTFSAKCEQVCIDASLELIGRLKD
ncbi:MAG: neutral/alkaline non-lysosomal ceramidase N-terminal domain-containing protein [Thermodesulfobacteriota bacterium]